MLNQQYPILTRVDSHIKPLLVDVLSTDKVGVCYGAIEVDAISSSCGKVEGDRFRLSIPYARQNLTWNVFFDSQCPEIGPDFIFNDNTFLADMDIDTLSAKVPSLTKWNPNNTNALLNVLTELLSCYKQYQMQLLQKQERLQLEYDMLMKSTLVKPEDVEMILLPSGSKPTEARFLINLSVDVSQLESRTCDSETDTAMLFIVFSGTDWNRVTPQLYLSKTLEKAFDGHPALNLPHFSADKLLIDYVAEVIKCIRDKINLIIQGLEKRRAFIAALLSHQFRSVVEYDSVNCTFTIFLHSEQDFYIVWRIDLLPGFPNEKPIVTFTSVYHMQVPHTVYTENYQNFPYNPRWELSFMVTKLLNFIQHASKKFRSNCIKKFS
ncbi:BRISC and BRCA1-A complex member 2 [Megachile rotundata]|uniref:BRISC and BRCA1-A complex member 2 n=1 Tax=Megachile rotundata TaxID=143995 RepID=UPI000258D7C7|nr:PREDICTED: BRCA1-A complex subunit BRE-like [Megachile rotundata]